MWRLIYLLTGTEDVAGGIDLSGLVSASSTGGDIVGTFLVYLTRPADDTSASLQAYLAGRGLIDVDASGKVIPRLKLVDGSGDPIGNFMADVENDKFFFAVKTSQTEAEAFDANIVFPNNFATNVSGTHDPVMVKVSAVSLGGGGTRAEVAEGDMGTISIEVTSVADGVEFNLPPSNVVNVFGTEELPIAVDMRGRLKDANEDISAVSVTVKDAGGAAVSGGMFVFRDALVEAAKTAGMLVDLTSDPFSSLDADGLAALALAAKADGHQYHGAIRPDGAFKTSFRDLTEADITTLKLSATDLTTESSGIYTVGTDPLALLNSGVDAKGNFNLSGVLFIPPPNTAGTLTAELSLTTSQGNTTQATTFGATADGGSFTFEISAVADAPTLSAVSGNLGALEVSGTEDVTGGIDLSGLVSASSTGGDIVGTFLVYLTRPADDTSESLQAYLAGRGLIDVDASGKVIPRLNLVDGSGDPIGNFIADVENDKFFFSVKTAGGENEAFDANIVFPNNFATDVSGTHDPVMVKVSAVSLGGGGTRAEVAEGDMGTISIEVTSVADGVEFNLPPSNVVNVFGTEELPIAVDMRGRLKDTNEDISAVSVTVKDAGGAAVSGGMFVFRDALVEAAKTAGMLVDLTSDPFSSLDADGLAALALAAKADGHQYNGAIRPDGAFKTSFRDLTEADITTLKLSATDLTTESSGIYTVGTDPLALLNSGVDAKGNFNLSGVLFIPPPNTAGTLTAELSLTTSQGNTTQATTFGATADGGSFTFEISAVADAPTLSAVSGNLGALEVSGTEDVTGGIDLSGLVSASSTGGDIVGTFLVYLTRPADDTSASLQAYLAGRGLIDVDASGKVIPGIQLVNDVGRELVTLSLKERMINSSSP